MTKLALHAPRLTQPPAGAAVAVGRRATLLDLLDRVLGKGVVVYGDIVLSIADLDLVYLNLRAVLSSIGTLESKNGGSWFVDGGSKDDSRHTTHDSRAAGGAPEPWEEAGGGTQEARGEKQEARTTEGLPASRPPPPTSSLQAGGKLELDPQKTAQGLAKLAMTLINLLRKLMERQAIRRMEAGTLAPEQLERAGQAFQQLDHQIKALCKQFGLSEADLNLDLGPLGTVV